MNRIASIELLRGLAAIGVMCFHFSIGRHIPVFTDIFNYGFIGVDLFFLVSGFVIYVSTDKDRDPVNFAVRRLFRIVPLAWAATAAAYVIMPRFAAIDIAADFLFYPSDTLTWAPLYHLHVLPSLWTLSYEMWFYLNFAFALWVAPQYRGLMASAQIMSALLLVQWPNLTTDAQGNPLIGLSFIANPMILYFPLGMFFGWIWQAGFRISSVPVRIIAGAGLCAWTWYVVTMYPATSGLQRIGAAAIPIFILMVGAVRLPDWILRRAGTVGALSYSIYLINLMIEPTLGQFAPLRFLQWYAAASQSAQVLVLILVTFTVAALAHFMIERPAQRLGKLLIERLRKSSPHGRLTFSPGKPR